MNTRSDAAYNREQVNARVKYEYLADYDKVNTTMSESSSYDDVNTAAHCAPDVACPLRYRVRGFAHRRKKKDRL